MAPRPRRVPSTAIDWKELAAPWERWEAIILSGLSSVNPVLFRALELARGQRVLDLCCGSGDPSLDLAKWVGPRGAVVGVDIAAPMLAVARRKARALRLRNVRFVRGELDNPPSSGRGYDRAVSRFGLMFAADPLEALDAIRRSLRTGGILAAAVWGPLKDNPSNRIRAELALPYREEPPPDPETSAHPLRFGRGGVLARLFRKAGFRRVRQEATRVVFTYGSVEECVALQRELPLAEVYAAISRGDRKRLDGRLRRAFRRFQDGAMLRVPGSAWVVSGRR